ncbi:40S ribosomal protein S15-3-like [Lolium rigidum]|uniref:40S ribosomal protein S15-3-like n=1 Tax=Lolium rigidum TaxID=89674 RepID=UPI001F5C5174|nr:40S ribosomal protein S15-3-like [Lolium rigidum]
MMIMLRRWVLTGSGFSPAGALLSCLQSKLEDADARAVRTHLRNMIIMPEIIGILVGIYNGKMFNQVEIKPEIIGHYLAEFSLSYKPVKHGRPGTGATHSSRLLIPTYGPNGSSPSGMNQAPTVAAAQAPSATAALLLKQVLLQHYFQDVRAKRTILIKLAAYA